MAGCLLALLLAWAAPAIAQEPGGGSGGDTAADLGQAGDRGPDDGAGGEPVMAATRGFDDVLMRLGGPVRVPAGDTASTIVAVGGDAVVDGHVRERLVVIGGTARVAGTVAGDVVVTGGRARLEPGAHVAGDVVLHESELDRAAGATVAGTVQRGPRLGLGVLAGWLVWIGATLFLLVSGLLFAALAGRQMREAAGLLRSDLGASALTAVIAAVGLPVLAVLAIVTVVGIPLGIAALVALGPLLALLGYLVTGCAIGVAVLARFGRSMSRARATRPLLAVAIGVALLQLVLIVPVLGGLIALVASALGAGALLYRSWRVLRRRPPGGAEAPVRQAA